MYSPELSTSEIEELKSEWIDLGNDPNEWNNDLINYKKDIENPTNEIKQKNLENNIISKLENTDDKFTIFNYILSMVIDENNEIAKKLNFNQQRLNLLEHIKKDLIEINEQTNSSFCDYIELNEKIIESCNKKSNDINK